MKFSEANIRKLAATHGFRLLYDVKDKGFRNWHLLNKDDKRVAAFFDLHEVYNFILRAQKEAQE